MNKFIPKNYKYKKIHKKVYINKLINFKLNYLKYNTCGLKILTNGLLSSIVLETIRKFIIKRIKKTGKLIINAYPYIPITKKSIGMRMGKGVGKIDKWVYPVKKGLILLELNNVSINIAKIIFKSISYKLPIKSKFVYLKKNV